MIRDFFEDPGAERSDYQPREEEYSDRAGEGIGLFGGRPKRFVQWIGVGGKLSALLRSAFFHLPEANCH